MDMPAMLHTGSPLREETHCARPTHQPEQLVSALQVVKQAAAVAADGVEYGEPPVKAVLGARVESGGARLLTINAAGREVRA